MYIKYFFMFSKAAHFYIYLNKTFVFFFKFNSVVCHSFKNVYQNYQNLILAWLKLFRGVANLNVKSLSINFITQNTNFNYFSNKQSFQNIFSKDSLLKNSSSDHPSYSYTEEPVSTLYNYFFLYDSLFYFLNRKKNTLNCFFNLLLNLKFNYFMLLINCNWHLILNLNNLFGSIRFSVISIIKLKGIRQYGLYSISYLWRYWSNFFMLILNISFYNIQILSFGRAYFKQIVNFFNWMSWSYSFYFWKMLNNYFFFKYSKKNSSSSNFFKNFKNLFFGITLVLDSNFHSNLLYFCNKYSIFNLSLIDTNQEPWLAWYPIPCRSSDVTLQYLLILLILKIRIVGYSFFLFFKLQYLFLLRLLSLLLYFNKAVVNYLLI